MNELIGEALHRGHGKMMIVHEGDTEIQCNEGVNGGDAEGLIRETGMTGTRAREVTREVTGMFVAREGGGR